MEEPDNRISSMTILKTKKNKTRPASEKKEKEAAPNPTKEEIAGHKECSHLANHADNS